METSFAIVVASFSGETALGPKSESCARRGRSGCATNEKPATGAPGGVFSRSSRISVSIVLTSRVGAGRSMPRASYPSGSSVSVNSSRLQAKPWISIRFDSRSGGEGDGIACAQRGAREADFGVRGGRDARAPSIVSEMPFHPGHIEKHNAFAGIFDARRKCFGHFEQRFLRGALAFGVAAAGDEL